MKVTKSKALFLVCFMVASGFCFAEKPATEASVRKLMEVTSADKSSVQMIEMMIPELKKMLPEVPDQFWVDFSAEIDGQELVELTIPVYTKNFSENEVRAAIAFFTSPEGAAFVQKQPVVARESVAIGMEWGESLAMRVIERAKMYKSHSP